MDRLSLPTLGKIQLIDGCLLMDAAFVRSRSRCETRVSSHIFVVSIQILTSISSAYICSSQFQNRRHSDVPDGVPDGGAPDADPNPGGVPNACGAPDADPNPGGIPNACGTPDVANAADSSDDTTDSLSCDSMTRLNAATK